MAHRKTLDVISTCTVSEPHRNHPENNCQHSSNDQTGANLRGVAEERRAGPADKSPGKGGRAATKGASKSKRQEKNNEGEGGRHHVHGYLPTARRTRPRTEASTLSLTSMMA